MDTEQLRITIDLLEDICQRRIEAHFQQADFDPFSVLEPSELRKTKDLLQLSDELIPEELIILLLATVPHLQPGFFENIITRLFPQGGEFVELGGAKGAQHRGMLPTGETALFVLAGMDFEKRLQVQRLFSEEGALIKQGLVLLEPVREGEPAMSGRLLVDDDWLEKVFMGKEAAPQFSIAFPARRISTPMDWDDLVLHPQTMEQVTDIRLWMQYNHHILDDIVLRKKVKPGYRILFYGPAGTGKTLTATLIGKEFELPVYRIDLSQVVSKYIGETEKNLEIIFARAKAKGWILFFDEADALFGKRTNVQSAHDKYANQEVSYLLQRVEEYPGLLILASNFKSNIDEAFLRRFHNIIHFPAPNPTERLKLWQKCTPDSLEIETKIDWEKVANEHEITGAGIVNVIQYAALRSFSRGDDKLRLHDVVDGIKRESRKEDK